MMTSNFKIKAYGQLKLIQHWHPFNDILWYIVHKNHNIRITNNFTSNRIASIIELFHKSTGHTIISMPVQSVTFANQ